MFGVGRDLQHGGRAGLEQEVIKDTRIALTKWNQSVGQREDHVEIRHAEQFLLSRGKPALARLRLALGAVAVMGACIVEVPGWVEGAIHEMSSPIHNVGFSTWGLHLQHLL